MRVTPSSDWNLINSTSDSKRYLIDYAESKVQFLEFEKDADIQLHQHEREALHIILEGKLLLDNGIVVSALSDYKCGGWEYTARALEKTRMVVIEPKSIS